MVLGVGMLDVLYFRIRSFVDCWGLKRMVNRVYVGWEREFEFIDGFVLYWWYLGE